MKIELYLDFPPSVNNYYVKTRNGVFISKAGQAYRSGSLERIADVLGNLSIQDNRLFPLSKPVSVTVVYYPTDKRKRDLDNYKKALYDVITHSGIWEDDSLIDQEFIYRGVVCPRAGFCWVLIDSDALAEVGNSERWRDCIREL